MTDPTASDNKAWLDHWARVGPKLEQVRRNELRAYKHEDNLAAIDALLEIGAARATPRTTSGLVALQRIFHKKTT